MHKIVETKTGEDVLRVNKEIANENLSMLRRLGIISFNIMGSIGSGKTLLIERIIDPLRENDRKPAVVAGDVAGDADYQRFLAHGVPAINVNTGKECHLEAHQIKHALEHLNLENIDTLFIENVGNLVCPADFPLGTDLQIAVVSVTEGDDMIKKHPVMFGLSDIVVINKIDLASTMEIDPRSIADDVRDIGSRAKTVLTDAKHGEGIQDLMVAMGLS